MNDTPKRPGLAYYQAASLVLLLTIAGFTIVGLWGVLGVAAPGLTIKSWEWRNLHARGVWLEQNYVRRHGLYYASAARDTAGVTLDEVTERWRSARDEALGLERRSGGQQVLLWIIALAVCLPLYRSHQRVVKRALEAAEAGAA